MLFDFNKWTAAAKACNSNDSNNEMATGTRIHLFVGANDAPKLVGQAYCLERLLAYHQYPNYHLVLMENTDHFDIVENMSKSNFLITKDIINEAKLFSTQS